MKNIWEGTYFASAGLDHKLARKMRRRLGLERADHDALVQRITGHNLRVQEIEQNVLQKNKNKNKNKEQQTTTTKNSK